MVEEDKTFENEVDKSTEPQHGGKREGAGRPLGSKSKKPWKGVIELAENIMFLLWIIYYLC